MEPSRKAASPPLQGCVVALSGTFLNRSQGAIDKDLIQVLGANLSKTVNADTTHLITTTSDFAKPSVKVSQAKSYDIPILTLAWLEDCLEQSTNLSEDSYSFGSSALATAPSAPVSNPSRPKRNLVAVYTDRKEEEEEEGKMLTQSKKKSKPASTTNSQVKDEEDSKITARPIPESKLEKLAAAGETIGNLATLSYLKIPVDEVCTLTHYEVYIDRDRIIYDAALNQTNASNNNNKFYRIQLLHRGGNYRTWTRWGRVGDRGQSSLLGDGSLHDAMKQFESKFKGKSGLSWSDRAGKPKSGKYTFIERSYGEESDEEEEQKVNTKDAPGVKQEKAPDSNLPTAVQDLMALIFNQQYFANTMADFNYDTNKLPLGKLAKSTIVKGYQALKDLCDLINDQTLAQSEYGTTYAQALEDLSNQFYSVIPHAFGRNRPPIIQTQETINKEVELLDSLSDMKDAQNIMRKEPKDAERVNALDRQFRGLGLEEMTVLKRESTEFQELKNYLVDTRGATHNANYHVDQIFRIERQGEKDRFDNSPFAGPPRDRRLLWHGSRATNFGGILSQGLRIAPPEAPASGYMFGKGIYLADMSSKSANYCFSHASNGHALLLLCEAELGDPKLVLTNASYSAGEDAKARGMISAWGQGMTGPNAWKDAEAVHPSLKGITIPDVSIPVGDTGVPYAYLQYNEYIAYDVAQVRLRYLFRVRM
ncbi:hypothetical protein LZ554_007083 [Drepanopeziza brunnea f. sp. 'monogermtubi']|nr:hypothetical protein LZ554_007083 [Drepanopeziza brunnea f. sp. 'monogermtubi']